MTPVPTQPGRIRTATRRCCLVLSFITLHCFSFLIFSISAVMALKGRVQKFFLSSQLITFQQLFIRNHLATTHPTFDISLTFTLPPKKLYHRYIHAIYCFRIDFFQKRFYARRSHEKKKTRRMKAYYNIVLNHSHISRMKVRVNLLLLMTFLFYILLLPIKNVFKM